MSNLEKEVTWLIREMEYSQWKHRSNSESLKHLPIVTREEIRKVSMKKLFYETKTSGSTGKPVTVQKTYADYVWYLATNAREILWRRWDTSKTLAVIKGRVKEEIIPNWGLPREIAPRQGKTYVNSIMKLSEIQSWLESIKPDYLVCLPSIARMLDFSKIPSIVDWKGTGELGGSMYSSEECGTIAITCPDNPQVYHVMENQVVEVQDDGGMVISTMTNPYIRRYKNGDHVELGVCDCGRSLQTIKKIMGRVRNMFVLPDGDRRWPLIGSREYFDKFGIRQFKAVQRTIDQVELQLVCEPLADSEEQVKSLCRDWLEADVEVTIRYVKGFDDYKFEEFVSLVTR